MKRYTAHVWLAATAILMFFRQPKTVHNEHVIQAMAMLKGHLWTDFPVWEHVWFKGHWYLLHPPLASLVMLPFAWKSGAATDQTVVSCLIGGIAVMLLYRLLIDLKVSGGDVVWLTGFFVFGTVFFYEATLGASWGLTSILSLVPTLLALSECSRAEPRWLLVGLWAGFAALGRYDLAGVFPLYGVIALRGMSLASTVATPCAVGGTEDDTPLFVLGRPGKFWMSAAELQ